MRSSCSKINVRASHSSHEVSSTALLGELDCLLASGPPPAGPVWQHRSAAVVDGRGQRLRPAAEVSAGSTHTVAPIQAVAQERTWRGEGMHA